jgi:lipopolysaccharide export system ATP-binding protein
MCASTLAADPAHRGAMIEAEPDSGVRLEVSNLVRFYGKRRVVDHVSLSLSQGEVVGLLGPNGAGKTTTFYMIVGLLSPNSGSVLLGGRDLTRLPMYRRARLGIGYLPQEASVFRKLTVRQNIEAILETMRLDREDREERLRQLLVELDIERLAGQKAYTLSGGERRRVEICRALAARPRFLLLDEPFVGIDPITVSEIQEIIASLRQKGLGILITDHNVRETLSATDRAFIIYEGRIMASGTPRDLAENPRVKEIYLGENFRL